MSEDRHLAAGGRVNIYKRTNSKYWQCQASINGKNLRVSSGTVSLEEARWFAEKWLNAQVNNFTSSKTSDINPITNYASAHESRNSFRLPLNDKENRILSAAIECVSQAGFRNTNMEVIAELAGLSPSTLYRYYSSRTELLTKVVSHVSQHEVNVVAGISMGNETPLKLLRKCAWTFASRAIQGRKLGYALVVEPVESEIEIERLKYRRKLMRVFATLIENGLRQNEMSNQTPEISAACIVGALFEALVGSNTREDNKDEQEQLKRVSEIVDFCVRGVS